jgi:hypothetical protein
VNGLLIDNLFTVTNSKDQPYIGIGRSAEKYRALFVRGDVGFRDFLFGEFTVRNDWYSVLPPSNNSILSKSFGGSFVFSDLLKIDALNFGKIRASWGEIPTAIGVYSYPGFAYGVGAYQWNGNFLMGTPDQLVDPNIHGAVKTQKELGLELRFFQSRIGLTATYWDGTEKDIPYAVSIANYSGFTSKYLNTGQINKKGIDLALNLKPVAAANFTWEMNATYSYLIDNKVVKIAQGIDKFLAYTNNGGWGPGLYHAVGMQWGQLFGSGMKMYNGQPMLTSNGMYVADPSKFFGSVLPKYTGGLQNSFKIMKNITVVANFDYQFGGKFFSLSEYWGAYSGLTAKTSGLNDKGIPIRDPVADGGGIHVFGVDATAATAATPTTVKVDYYVDAQTYFHYLGDNYIYDPYIYDLSYIKLREFSIGYNIPVAKLGNVGKYIQGLNVSLIAQNAWLIWAKSKDIDPSEASQTTGESGQFPGIRSYGVNVKLNF